MRNLVATNFGHFVLYYNYVVEVEGCIDGSQHITESPSIVLLTAGIRNVVYMLLHILDKAWDDRF